MKEIVPTSPPMVRNQFESIRELYSRHVLPTYARFDIAFTRGEGSHLWDVNGRRYLDLGGGIAVCALGHAHPELSATIAEQSGKLWHVSNLYYQEPQGRLAARLVSHLAPGRVFFCNSGAEANEGLFKLARRFGHEEGRFEILTAQHSFHGRTLAGIAATGQEKVKMGFEPATPGFRHIPFNDLKAAREALSPATVAILLEGIQGEGGITPATPEYLLGLRQLCDEHNLLLLMDAVQCGHFRSGRFQSFQRILENAEGAQGFLPDAVSMAKALGGGFPMGAFWVQEQHAGLLGPGSHGTTFGGAPLGASVALKIIEIIERDRLEDHIRNLGDWFKAELQKLIDAHPKCLTGVRGLGFMLGLELAGDIPAFAGRDGTPSIQMTNRLHAEGLLVIPSGARVIRFLPAFNLVRAQAEEGLSLLRKVVGSLG